MTLTCSDCGTSVKLQRFRCDRCVSGETMRERSRRARRAAKAIAETARAIDQGLKR